MGRHGVRAAVVVVALGAIGGCSCGAEEPAPLATDVLGIVEQRCASGACHGAAAGAGLHVDPTRWLTFSIDGDQRLVDPAGALASMQAKVNSAEGVERSTLLRKTLPLAQGGLYHFQGAVFPSREDADYRALADWAASVTGTEGLQEPPLDALEQRFADDVYPLLIQKGCATGTCHGSLNFGVSAFHAPAVPGTLELPRAELRATYREARHNVTTWGPPARSRLVAKMLPLEYGGVPHKGGNDLFFAAELEAGQDPRSSPALAPVLAWIDAERAATVPADAPPAGTHAAIVFVGGPLPVAGPFDVAPFTPGSELYRLDPPYTGAPVNLTASAHVGPADVRDPAISHDGRTIVFTMRTSEADAANVWTIGVDGTNPTQLTHDVQGALGPVVASSGPVFGPNGGARGDDGAFGPSSRIYFSSTREAGWSDDARYANAELWAMDPDGSHLERLTFTVVPEVAPAFLAASEFAGSVAYTIQRSADGGYKGVLFRFPIDHNPAFHLQPEAHPHFGMSEPQQVFYRAKELVDGRSTLVLLDEENLFRAGELAVLERQFAVELPVGAEATATLPGFRHALTSLVPEIARTGSSAAGAFRDPTPLPDGSILVAFVDGPVELSDPAAAPRPRLVRVVFAEDRATSRPVVTAIERLFDDPALAASQPVAVYARAPEDPPHERAYTDDPEVPGTLVHSGVQVIEAVLAQLPPERARDVREDLTIVRVMVPLSVAAALAPVAVPAAETRSGLPGATTLSLTGQMPLFAAIEVPVAADGSLAAHVPARVPVRVVTLNDERIATGALQHQWYAVQPGERFPVGIPASAFSARCAGCHGAMDGRPESVLRPTVDLVTQASVTAALYEASDRRRPLELPTVDGTMFRFVDFRAHVQPVLDARCTAGCHEGATPAGGLSLTGEPTAHYTNAYEALLAPGEGSASGFALVDARGHRARRSYLAEKLLGRELDAPKVLTQSCPPPGATQLSEEERLTLLRWIEFGASFVGLPPSP